MTVYGNVAYLLRYIFNTVSGSCACYRTVGGALAIHNSYRVKREECRSSSKKETCTKRVLYKPSKYFGSSAKRQ